MQVLDIKTKNAPDENSKEAKQKYLDDTAKAIVRKYVWDEFRELPKVMSPDESKKDLPKNVSYVAQNVVTKSLCLMGRSEKNTG